MIDTIVFKLNDISDTHLMLATYFEIQNQGITKGYAEISQNEIDNLHNKQKVFGLREYKDNDKFFFFEVNTKSKPNSYHYSINVKIDWNNDCIEFEFSIPKFLHGTNVLQFHENLTSKNFFVNDYTDFNPQKTFKLFQNFVPIFFEKTLPEEIYKTIDFSTIIIKRIDLCYNLVFNSSSDMKEYFENIKCIKKKYAREQNSTIYNNSDETIYGDAITFKSKGLFCKIYQKGNEFKKHDFKKLIEINKKDKIYNLDNLTELANKTLRYEVSYKPYYLNYLYKNHIFKTKSDLLINFKKVFNKYKNGKNAKVNTPAYKKYLQILQDKPLLNNILAFDKFLFKIDNCFFLPYNYPDEILFSNDYNFTLFSLTKDFNFNFKFFQSLYNHFRSFISDFTLKSMPQRNDLIKKIKQYNKDKTILKTKLDSTISTIYTTNLIIFYELLKYKTFQQIEDEKIFSNGTFYRLKSKLKEFGITKQSLLNVDIPVQIDFHNYLNHIITKPPFYKIPQVYL